MIGSFDNERHSMGMPWLNAASLGTSSGVVRVAVSGNNADVATGSASEDIWAGSDLGTINTINHHTIQIPQTATAMEVVSDNAADTAAGAGLRSAQIIYLDAAYVSKTVTVVMNGTTPVALPEPVVAINSFARATTGTFMGANIGNVSIRAVGGTGATYSYMRAGIGSAQSAIYTVPDAHTMILDGVTYSLKKPNAGDATADFYISSISGTGALLKSSPISVASAATYRTNGGVALAIVPARTALWVSVTNVTGNNTGATATMYGIRIPNSKLVPQ